jgi:hypothetical protein
VDRVCSAPEFVHSKVRNGLNNVPVQRLMCIYIDLRLVSKLAAELGDGFDWENLMVLSDVVLGMSAALYVNSSGVEEVE